MIDSSKFGGRWRIRNLEFGVGLWRGRSIALRLDHISRELVEFVEGIAFPAVTISARMIA